MVWVVPSENWSVADPVFTPVTVPRWNPRSWGVCFSLLPNLLYCGAGLVARNRTWTFSFGRKREGGQEAQRPVLWYGAYGVARVHDGVLDWVSCGGEHCFGKSFVC